MFHLTKIKKYEEKKKNFQFEKKNKLRVPCFDIHMYIHVLQICIYCVFVQLVSHRLGSLRWSPIFFYSINFSPSFFIRFIFSLSETTFHISCIKLIFFFFRLFSIKQKKIKQIITSLSNFSFLFCILSIFSFFQGLFVCFYFFFFFLF